MGGKSALLKAEEGNQRSHFYGGCGALRINESSSAVTTVCTSVGDQVKSVRVRVRLMVC